MIEAHTWTDGGERVLILRRISRDGTSHGGFAKWGEPNTLNNVVTPDKWNPSPTCGDGLHGWPWGMGLGEGCDYSLIEDRWLIISARPEDVVGSLEGGAKCKVRECQKIFDGTFSGAWALINGGRHRLIEAMAKEGDNIASGAASSGYRSTAASSGYRSTAASSGYRSTAASSGYGSTAASSGYGSTAASSGYGSKAASSGDSSTAASSGYGSKAASSGDRSKAASSGDSSTAASSGYGSKAASSGDRSTAASSGYGSKAASSGDRSTAASSGYGSTAASSGDRSTAASSGYGSTAAQDGERGIAAAIGSGGMARAGHDGALIVCWWSSEEKRYRVCVGYVGEDGVKADTWYSAVDGRLVEVQDAK